jgi:hypothetical protein
MIVLGPESGVGRPVAAGGDEEESPPPPVAPTPGFFLAFRDKPSLIFDSTPMSTCKRVSMAVWQQVVGRLRLRFDFSVPDHVAEYLLIYWLIPDW